MDRVPADFRRPPTRNCRWCMSWHRSRIPAWGTCITQQRTSLPYFQQSGRLLLRALTPDVKAETTAVHHTEPHPQRKSRCSSATKPCVLFEFDVGPTEHVDEGIYDSIHGSKMDDDEIWVKGPTGKTLVGERRQASLPRPRPVVEHVLHTLKPVQTLVRSSHPRRKGTGLKR